MTGLAVNSWRLSSSSKQGSTGTRTVATVGTSLIANLISFVQCAPFRGRPDDGAARDRCGAGRKEAMRD